MTEVSRGIRWAANAIPIIVIPSGLWRIALGVGIPVGFSGELGELYRAPGWITPYVFGLTLATEAAALLCLGLVRRWGEVVPDWVPRIGGRKIPVRPVVAAATLGVIALTMITIPTVALWNGPENMGDPDSPQGLAGLIMTACYAPQIAWAPLLAVLTVAYYRRRTRAGTRGRLVPAG